LRFFCAWNLPFCGEKQGVHAVDP